ncbi:acyl-coenzyme A synthetase ACSM6, mitochondrial-like isoform X2 [Tachyglossus aculeatus]|nr:acyl-coenzyme A synthetase ACSM6, mitochondrial-like isoform X2 [Tachyglossus aculeatus]
MSCQCRALASVRSFGLRWRLCLHPSRKCVSQQAPVSELARLSQEVPRDFNYAGDVLDKWSQMEKDGLRVPHSALWEVDAKGAEVRWSFEELGILSRKAARVLTEACNLHQGDRVAMLLPPGLESYLISLACMRTGLVFVPGSSQLTVSDILHRLRVSEAKCIVTNDDLAPAIDSIESHCPSLKTKLLLSDDNRGSWLNFPKLIHSAPTDHRCVRTKSRDAMAIYFTSGTAGSPKMVEHSHYSLGMGFSLATRWWMDLEPADVVWGLGDASGVDLFSLSSALGAWLQGACLFLHHLPKFSSETVLDALSRFPITTFYGRPSLYQRLLQDCNFTCYRFQSLKHCVATGEPSKPGVNREWKRLSDLDIYEGYGQTETGLICATDKRMKMKPGSLGKPVLPYNVQIVDENLNILPPGEEGNIAVQTQPIRPFSLFSRYVDNIKQTALAEPRRFYLTGDKGIMDEEGYFWFAGRADDIINASGW